MINEMKSGASVDAPLYFTTSVNPTGNRVLQGCGANNNDTDGIMARRLHETDTILPLESSATISWVVGVTSSNSQAFVVTSSGLIQNLLLPDNETKVVKEIGSSSPNRPLVVSAPTTSVDTAHAIIPPEGTSEYAPIAPLLNGPCSNGGGSLSITTNQRVRQVAGNGTDLTAQSVRDIIAPLTDGHIVYSSRNQQWALYGGATADRYVHGVLGDALEGYMLYILTCDSSSQQIEVTSKFELPGNDQVFEGLAPIWADVNDDGIDDILTTVSATGEGARLKVFEMEQDSNDEIVLGMQADSAPIGTGQRWRHQLGVGPLGPNGETEIVEVRTPHLQSVVRYFQLQDGDLEQAAELAGLTSHFLGSRNLDMALVADFDGDGHLEVVLQRRDGSGLVGLQRTLCGVNVAWKIPTTGPGDYLVSNLGVTCNTVTDTMDLFYQTQRGGELQRVHWHPVNTTELSPAVQSCVATMTGRTTSPTMASSGSTGTTPPFSFDASASASTASMIWPLLVLCLFLRCFR